MKFKGTKLSNRTVALFAAAILLLSSGGFLGVKAAPQIRGQDSFATVNLNTIDVQLVDKAGKEVWLTGVNWFGYNTGSGIFDGVWACNALDALQAIADHGFNLLRVPISVEIILQWKSGEPDPKVPQINGMLNPELCEEDGTLMDSFKAWKVILKKCKEVGLKIMLDIHSAESHAAGHLFPLWYHGSFTTEDWLEALEWIGIHIKMMIPL